MHFRCLEKDRVLNPDIPDTVLVDLICKDWDAHENMLMLNNQLITIHL
jgi:hypothetical protein